MYVKLTAFARMLQAQRESENPGHVKGAQALLKLC